MTQRISHQIDGAKTLGTSDRLAPVYNPATGQGSAEVDLASVRPSAHCSPTPTFPP